MTLREIWNVLLNNIKSTSNKYRSGRTKSAFIIFIGLAIILAGCGGLASEPGIVRTAALPTITPTVPPDKGQPTDRINLARGAEIFGGQQGCQNCHGIGGQGDGPTSANFSCKLTSFTDAEANRSKTVQAWFGIVSNGNNGDTTCLMPPWKNRFNEQDRWNVTSYIYSLHYTPDMLMLTQGKTIYAQNCQSCHGETGIGDGPQAPSQNIGKLTNFSNPAALISQSDTSLWKTVTNGLPDGTHSYKNTLTDDQRWAVVAYTRSLSWNNPGSVAQGTTPAVTQSAILSGTLSATAAATGIPDEPTVTVGGKVINGTSGGKVPAGVDLTLGVISSGTPSAQNVSTFKTKTAVDGSYTFGAVPRQNDHIYIVVANYGGTLQRALPINLQAGSGSTLDIPLTIYEPTNDPTVIHIELQRMFVDFTGPNSAFVQQGIRFRATGDHIFVGADPKSQTVLQIALPSGAQNVQLSQDSDSRFAISPDATSISSAIAITPTETASLQYTYVLPFSDKLTLTTTTAYTIDQQEIELPQVSNTIIQDAAFEPGQAIQLDTGTYNTYTRLKPIPASSQYAIPIVLPTEKTNQQRNTLAVILILAMILFGATIGAIITLNRRSTRSTASAQPSTSQALLEAIAALDEQFEAGSIAIADYETQRAQLKAQLVKLASRLP